MKTNLKRIGAWALCFMLLLSCIPVSADDGTVQTRDFSAGYSLDSALPTANYDVSFDSKISYSFSDRRWSVPVYYYLTGTTNLTKVATTTVNWYGSASISPDATYLNSINATAMSIKVAAGVSEAAVVSSTDSLSVRSSTYDYTKLQLECNNIRIGSSNSSDDAYNTYAVFVEYKYNTVTATFDLNGGTATDITPITKDPGTEIKLPTTEPTREGYTFLGWKVEGDETPYRPGGSYVLSTNTTFTAQWAKNSTITFDYGGVTDVNGNTQIQYQDLKYGETYSFPDLENISWNGDDLDNRVMDCWTDPDGNLYSVYDKYEYTVTGNITYTLVWVYADNYCNIEFSIGDHGVFEGSDPETPAEPIEVQIPLNQRINAYLDMQGENIAVVPNTGYGFKGWVDSTNGQLLTDQTFVKGDMSFVAQYYKLITATFDLGEDVAFTDYPTDENNSLVIGPDDDQLIFYLPTREQVSVSGAKVLDKWVDNFGQEYQPGEQVSLAESRTFTAVTTANCYTIHFDANGDTIGTAPENIYVAKGDTFEFPAQGTMDHSRSNYVFGGWATSNNATAAQYLPGDAAPVPADDTTYYAVWLSGYTITFYQNIDNNHNDSFTIKVPAGSTLTFPELPNDWNVDGYTFSGWSINKSGTTSDGEGAVFRPGIQWTYKPTSGTITTPTINQNYTFYGRWIQESAEDSNPAYFHIKMDGKIPFEPTGYTNTSAYSKNDGMRGTVRTSTPVANDTDAVAKNIQSAPNLETIYDTLVRHSEFSTYFPEVANQGVNAKAYFVANYKVVWYVIKYVGCNGGYHWHVDGIAIPKESYLVKYDPNGGTDAPLQHSQFKDDDVTVQFSPEPTRVGYTFLGWSEDPNATTPTYTSTGDKNFTMPEHDVTLYAVWKPNTSTAYKVQYYYSDESGNYSSYDSEVTRYGTTGSVARVTTEDKKSTKLGYVLDTSKQNEYSGVILADGTLALKVYFKYTGFPFRTVNVEKVWRNPDSSAVFPSVIINLMRDGTVIDTCTLSAENNWSGSFTDLPQYSPQSTLYQYTVTENAVDGYTTSITPTSVNASTYTVTNTLTNKDVVVTKNWEDSSNDYGTRPATITLKLMNGTTVAETKTVTPEATAVSQTVTFTVPAYNSDGTVATYTVEEDGVNGYTTSVDGLTVTNTLKTYSLTVEKQIAGNMAYDQQEFTFTAKLLKPQSSTGANGEDVNSGLNFTNSTAEGFTPEGNNGVTFKLKANEFITLNGIPYGYSVSVTESGTAGYTVKTSQDGGSNWSTPTAAGADGSATVGPFTYDANVQPKVIFKNTNNATIDTGVTLDFLPYVLLILGVGVVVALWLVMSAKKRKDD